MGESKSNGELGFRDFESFNRVMFAKQCWRLLQFPDSLAAKVLKDKYLKRTDLLGRCKVELRSVSNQKKLGLCTRLIEGRPQMEGCEWAKYQ